MPPRKRPSLTEAEWRKVFDARCLGKRGLPLTSEQRELVDEAYEQNPERYGSMESEIFNATVPFGSTVRYDQRPRKAPRTKVHEVPDLPDPPAWWPENKTTTAGPFVGRKPASVDDSHLTVTHRALKILAKHGPTSASIFGAILWRDNKRGRTVSSNGGGDYAAQCFLGRLRKKGWAQVEHGEGASKWELSLAGRTELARLERDGAT